MSSIEEIAARLERRADRCAATNDKAGELLAKTIANQVRRCTDVKEAERIASEFEGTGTGSGAVAPQGCLASMFPFLFRGGSAPTAPGSGLNWGSSPFRTGLAGGAAYSLLGGSVRSGGSQAWRNNNPGLIPYDDYAVQMGAVGNDGGIAMFPDQEAGRRALQERMRRREGSGVGGSTRVDDLVENSFLDSPSGSPRGQDVLRDAGIAPGTDLSALSDADIARLTDAIENHATMKGEEYASDSADAPAWVSEATSSDNS